MMGWTNDQHALALAKVILSKKKSFIIEFLSDDTPFSRSLRLLIFFINGKETYEPMMFESFEIESILN